MFQGRYSDRGFIHETGTMNFVFENRFNISHTSYYVVCIVYSVCAILFSTITHRAIQTEVSIVRMKLKYPKHFVMAIIHTIHIKRCVESH